MISAFTTNDAYTTTTTYETHLMAMGSLGNAAPKWTPAVSPAETRRTEAAYARQDAEAASEKAAARAVRDADLAVYTANRKAAAAAAAVAEGKSWYADRVAHPERAAFGDALRSAIVRSEGGASADGGASLKALLAPFIASQSGGPPPQPEYCTPRFTYHNGDTALHYAAGTGYPVAIRVLLEDCKAASQPVDTDLIYRVRNKEGKSAWDVATPFEGCVEALKKYPDPLAPRAGAAAGACCAVM